MRPATRSPRGRRRTSRAAQLVFEAAQHAKPFVAQSTLAKDGGCERWAMGRWRRSRIGRKEPVITPEAKAWLVSLACDKAKEHGYPHEVWTTRLLARHAREHGPTPPDMIRTTETLT
jgi:hypothetical protein